MEFGSGLGVGVEGEGLVFADYVVDADGVEDVAEHDFAGLEGGVAEAELEELEDADLEG